MFLEDREARQDHGTVDGKGRAEMGRESILADAWMAAGVEQVVVETTLDHPPADEALTADHAADADKLQGHGGRNLFACDEVGGGD